MRRRLVLVFAAVTSMVAIAFIVPLCVLVRDVGGNPVSGQIVQFSSQYGLVKFDASTAVTDAKAFVDFLDAQSAVTVQRKMGTMGYCMSGPIALRTAAARSDRIGGVATFHGGGLVSKDPDSPHLLVGQTRAHYLIAIAANDDEREPETKTVLRASFDHAHLDARDGRWRNGGRG